MTSFANVDHTYSFASVCGIDSSSLRCAWSGWGCDIFVERLGFCWALAELQRPPRRDAKFCGVRFHETGKVAVFGPERNAGRERDDLPISICVLKIRWRCAGSPRRAHASSDTPWCNGNTAPFGGVIHGSNPCGVAHDLEVEGAHSPESLRGY